VGLRDGQIALVGSHAGRRPPGGDDAV